MRIFPSELFIIKINPFTSIVYCLQAGLVHALLVLFSYLFIVLPWTDDKGRVINAYGKALTLFVVGLQQWQKQNMITIQSIYSFCVQSVVLLKQNTFKFSSEKETLPSSNNMFLCHLRVTNAKTLERLLNVFLGSHSSETREDSDGCPLYLQLQVLPNSSYLTNCVFLYGRHLLLLQMFFDVRCPGPDLNTLDGRQSLSHLICVNTTVPCSGMVLKLCLRPFEKVVLSTLHVCMGTVSRRH